MGLFQRVKDWVNQKIANLTAWLRTQVAKAIEDLVVWLRVKKFEFKKWLAGFVSTTYGFWIFIGTILLVTIGVAYVQSTELWGKFVASVQSVVEKVKNGTGQLLARAGYSLLLTAHKLGLALNKDYAAAWTEIYKGIGALSEELRMGVSTISLTMRNARAIIYAAGTFAGIDSKVVEGIYDDSAGKFLGQLEDRFARYARSPELIWEDIDREIVWPMVDLMQGGQADVLKAISETGKLLSQKSKELEALKTTVDTFVADLPEEISTAADETWGKVSEAFDTFFDEHIIPIRDKLDSSLEIIDGFLQGQEEKIQRLTTDYLHPGDLMANIFLLPEPFRSQQLDLIHSVFELSGYYEAEAIRAESVLKYNNSQSRLRALLSGSRDSDRVVVSRLPDSRKELSDTTFDTWYYGGY